MRRWLALGVLVLLLGPREMNAQGMAEATMADEREDAVVEAVYRALLVEAAPGATETVCLVVRRTVDGKEQMGDPSDALLARLQKETANLRRGSQCEDSAGAPAPAAATAAPPPTAGPLVIDIGPVTWTGNDAARTGGGFSRGRMGTFEFEYELTRANGGWKITKTTRKAII